MRVLSTCVWILLVVLASCASPPPTPEVDLAEERADLLEADQAWSESVDDVDEFLSFFAEGAYFMPPDAPMAQGKAAIRPVARNLFSAPGFEVVWKPSTAEVSESADLGYTVGTYQLTTDDAEGNPVTTVGKYLTTWRKSADGEWKVLADCFNADGPPDEQ